MTGDRSLSPALEGCLEAGYASSQKGGTLIVADVVDLETHRARLCDPDGYRPERCPRCGSNVHVHDCRSRALRDDEVASVDVMRYRCSDRRGCGAVWQLLPGFLPRWLRRCWSIVETALADPNSSPVPARTRRRWKARLKRSARRLVTALTTATDEVWTSLATKVGLEGSRSDLVTAYREQFDPPSGGCLSELSEAIHRLDPGLRLM